jgi:penicillin-binding protein 1B
MGLFGGKRLVRRYRKVTTQGAGIRPRRMQRIKSALKILTGVVSILVFATAVFLFRSYSYYARIVDARLASGYLTSRAGIYAAPRVLRPGQNTTVEDLAVHLRRAGYVESAASDVWSGSFTVSEDAIEIRPTHTESATTPDIVRVAFGKKNRIEQLTGDGLSLDQFALEPEVLTSDSTMKSGNRTALGFNDLPSVLVHAILSTEDHRFFDHSGIDFVGIVRAALRNAGDEHMGQGGSTVTQQLVKNTYLSPERTFKRKFAEAMLAFVLERRLSKQDIFALYCNEIYLGQRGASGVRGVAQAARIYFGKEVRDLTLPEAAMIAGMIQSPSRFSLDHHPDAAIARRSTVLGTMVRDGAVSIEEASAAAKAPLQLAGVDARDDSLAPYFVDSVNRSVDIIAGGPGVDGRGLRVFTTIDIELQKLAEDAVAKQLDRLDKNFKNGPTPQAALVALDPATGDVLAMVGGRNYGVSQLNRATDAARQPGSVYKPIVYSAAIESGMSPLSMFQDAPQVFKYDDHASYRPANYGGGFSMQDVTMRTALIKSLNVVTVDVAMRTGLKRVAETAASFGLPRPQAYPSLALGTTESSPLNIAAAYTTFVNGGKRVEPRFISHVVDGNAKHIVDNLPITTSVISPTTAYMVTDILSGVIEHGTAKAARGIIKHTAIAGKTGTSRDGWFVGYTPNLVVAVWVGFDDNKQLGITGAEAALPAWTDFVSNAVSSRPELGGAAFDRPEGITFIDIDPDTGLRVTDGCPQTERIAIKTSWVPNGECYKHFRGIAPSFAGANPSNFTNGVTRQQTARESSLSDFERELPAQIQPSINGRSSTARPTRREKNTLGISSLVNDVAVTN